MRDQNRADRKRQKWYGCEGDRGAERVREGERHQHEAYAHHFRGPATRAQIVEREAKHQQESGEEHVGGAGNDAPQQRRMERYQDGSNAGH